ncbi:MAG TPA: hypothetical protein VHB48_17625 [Chitinophagaceae bacterium]|nr:hypothetical protein [Chitinophagaceae bacterium]
MDIVEHSEVPFEEFGWQVTLFHMYRDATTEAAIEIIGAFDPKSLNLDWKDEWEIKAFIQSQNLFEKINALAIQKFEEEDI